MHLDLGQHLDQRLRQDLPICAPAVLSTSEVRPEALVIRSLENVGAQQQTLDGVPNALCMQ